MCASRWLIPKRERVTKELRLGSASMAQRLFCETISPENESQNRLLQDVYGKLKELHNFTNLTKLSL